MRVLLVPQKSNYPSAKPCLDIIGQGFPYVAAALRAGGHEVFAVNLNYRWCRGSVAAALQEALHQAVAEYQPQLIGVGGLSADYPFIRQAIQVCREVAADTPIVCGGGIMTYDAEFIFSDLRPDFGVVGEAEETIVSLANALGTGSRLEEIPNVIHWKDGQAVHNPVAYSRTDLDQYPFPDYEPFDIETYLEWTNQAHNWLYAHTRRQPRIMPLSMARSCPYDCTFCCHTVGPKYRARSVDSVIAEISDLYERYRFNMLFIYDELFSVKKDKVREFCARVVELKFDFDWTCDLRVVDAEPELLGEMKKAGCIFIGYGLESGSPTVLKSMKKGITVEQIERAIRLTDEAGIGVQGNLIFGDPAETASTIAQTMRFYRRHCRDLMVCCHYVTPYPGSQIFQYCLEKGIIRDRKAYYEKIGSVPKTMTMNMTSMSSGRLRSLVDPFIRDEPAGYLRVEVDSCQRRQALPCDEGTEWWRVCYELALDCPHCRARVTYLYPLPENLEARYLEAAAICAACHKRFMMRIPIQLLIAAGGESFSSGAGATEVVSVNRYGVPTLLDSYRGFNLVEFRHRVYALAQDLGLVDLTTIRREELQRYQELRKCFVTRSAAEARRMVTRWCSRSRPEKVSLRQLARRTAGGLWRFGRGLARLTVALIFLPIGLLMGAYKGISRLVGRGRGRSIFEDGQAVFRALGIAEGSRGDRLLALARRTGLAIKGWVRGRKESERV